MTAVKEERAPHSHGDEGDLELRRIVRWTSWASLLPVLGWIYGIGTLWSSPQFRRRDKVIGSLLFPGGWFGALVAVWFIGYQSSGYCYEAHVGEVDSSPSVTESGCVQLGVLNPAVGLALAILVLLAAALGPVYLRSRGRSATGQQ